MLHVDGLDADPLSVEDRLGRGDPAVVAGYPGNGPYTLSPGRVRQPVTARGLDIYDERPVERDIYSLRATVRSGNSGGPLLDDDGEVASTVFARSTSDPDTGYALTMDEIAPVLQRATADRSVAAGSAWRTDLPIATEQPTHLPRGQREDRSRCQERQDHPATHIGIMVLNASDVAGPGVRVECRFDRKSTGDSTCL